MPRFYEVCRGAFSCCLRHTPISALIHYLWRVGTHRPQKYTRRALILPRAFAPTHKYFRFADIPNAVSPRDLCVSGPLPAAAANLWPLSHPGCSPPNSLLFSVAGQRGSWWCRRPQLLLTAAEADMGKEVLGGIGRLGLVEFLHPDVHWLNTKYVFCVIFDVMLYSTTIWESQWSSRQTDITWKWHRLYVVSRFSCYLHPN